MRFLAKMAVKRTDKNPDVFCMGWDRTTAQAALTVLDGTAPTYVEFLQCPDGDAGRAEPGKMFLDRDVYVGPDPPTEAVVSQHTSEVVSNVQMIVDRLGTDTNDLSFVIATRHGYCPGRKEHKLSFRPFVQGMSIRYTDIPRVIRFMGQQQFWDMSVYKASEQLLAAINCCKGKLGPVFDGRVLQPQPGAEDPLLYVAQHVEEGWAFLDIPQDVFSDESTSPGAVAGAGVGAGVGAGPSVCPVFVRALVACLGSTSSDDRKTWLSVAFVLKGLERDGVGFFDVWDAFSMKSSKYAGKFSGRRTWDGVSPNGSCSVGTLCFYAQRDDRQAYLKAVSERSDRSIAKQQSVEIVPIELTRESVNTAYKMITHELGLSDIDEDSIACTKDGDILRVTLRASKDRGALRHMCVDLQTKELKLSIDGQCVGYLHTATGIPVDYSLAPLDNSFDDDMSWRATRPTDGQVRFRSDSRGAEIRASNFNQPLQNRSAQVAITGGANKTKRAMKDMLWLQNAHDDAVLNMLCTLGLGSLFVAQNGDNNNITINLGRSGENDFEAICLKLLKHAKNLGLRKWEGMVYKPVEHCPCAFAQHCTYKKYINDVLAGDPLYTKNPKRYDECIKMMTNYECKDDMPDFQGERDLLSFSDGVCELAMMKFTPYSGINRGCALTGRVARHHIPHVFSQSSLTPMLDVVLDAQFDRDVSEVLCALIGRTLFQVNQLDKWQVMPFLVGIGGTGKSLVLNIITRLFAPGSVGNLAAKREDVFGMANLVDKEIVIGRDMPAKMSGSLPQDIMQCMTSGEEMEVPRKGLTALHAVWTSAVVMAGNHYPDYINTGNNIGRRMVTFRFDNVIQNPDDDLQQNIIDSELPNIVWRCLQAYSVLRARVKQVKGFWKAVPPVMLEWRNKLSASTNKLSEFFAMDDDDRMCTITHVEGRVTWLTVFKSVFEAKMGKATYVGDTAVFASLGFRVSPTRVNICMGCKQVGKAKGGRCCNAYNNDSNRAKQTVIYDMVLTPILKFTGQFQLQSHD